MILRKLNREIFMDQSLIEWTHGYLNESKRNQLIGKKYLVKSESFYLR